MNAAWMSYRIRRIELLFLSDSFSIVLIQQGDEVMWKINPISSGNLHLNGSLSHVIKPKMQKSHEIIKLEHYLLSAYMNFLFV